MEIAGLVVQVVKCISPAVAQRWKYHRGLNENMVTLKQRLEELISRKSDIRSRLDIEHVSGETMLKNEVERWLRSVETIKDEIDTIEDKVKKVKFCSRASLGKNVEQKIGEVRELYEKGVFSDGLVISLPRRGEALPTTILGGEATFKRKMEEIWACLMDREVTKIGVYGMAGIGKTTALEHINNRLLEEKDKFDKVIWVTASKDCNVVKLKDKIARKLDLDISKDNDEKTKAGKLYETFKKNKRYVLILDDLWEEYSLKEVGIPEPTPQNGCKLIVTTRSHDVCREMSCEPNVIEMELLSKKEALDLFLDIVGRNILSVPKLEEIVKEVVHECASLPLAIVTIAGSLRGIVDCCKWETALEDLRGSTKGSKSEKIFDILKFSYDRLKDKKLQYCLLYCALYSEDSLIERKLLIDQFIGKGIIEKNKKSKKKKMTRQYKMKKGQEMLDKLVNVCLLNDTIDCEGAKCVKMHDLIRDMAIQITSDHTPRFLAKAGEELESIPDEENWTEDLVEVSLMDNNIIKISSSIKPPKCPRISTLFLNRNRQLRRISGKFFLHMVGLNVLDLSDTGIVKLPDSVSDLVNLAVLLLKGCVSLQHVPSLAKLSNLRRLDFSSTELIEVPHGIEMLVKLRYLDFSETRLALIPDGILCKLTYLQYLAFIGVCSSPRIRGEELAYLRKLETFQGVLYDINSFNAYVRSLEKGVELTKYRLQLGHARGVSWDAYYLRNRIVVLTKCNISIESIETEKLLLPEDVEELAIEDCCFNVSSLCKLAQFNEEINLKCLMIDGCDGIEHLFSYSSNIFPLLQSLEKLDVEGTRDLRRLIRMERFESLPPGSFSSLKELRFCNCDNMKKLFILNDASFPNLEEIIIFNCKQLEEIVSTTSDQDNEDQTEKGRADDHHAITLITFPKLRKLQLSELPELKSIPVVADSLQKIEMWNCPMLKKIPLLDREPCPPLRYVQIGKDIWESLEWDYPKSKDEVQSIMDHPRYENSEIEEEEMELEEEVEEEDDDDDDDDDDWRFRYSRDYIETSSSEASAVGKE